MTHDERAAAVQELWLHIAQCRDRALALSDEFEATTSAHSTLWLAGEDLQQAAHRVRRVVDKTR
jgi:hypothetical protein